MELWDVLDEYGDKTGRTIERGKPLNHNEFHLVIDVWIRNSSGDFLISQRTANKTFPNMWETTGGSAIVGENSLQSALREVREEIGIELDPENGQLAFRLKIQHQYCPYFRDIWLFQQDADIDEVIYQPEEVCNAKWASRDEILSMIKKGEFVDVYTYLDGLFDMFALET